MLLLLTSRSLTLKTKLLSLLRLSFIFVGIIMMFSGCDLFSNEEDDPQPTEELTPITISLHIQSFGLPLDEEIQIQYAISPDTAKVTDLVWTSSNPKAATVSQTG